METFSDRIYNRFYKDYSYMPVRDKGRNSSRVIFDTQYEKNIDMREKAYKFFDKCLNISERTHRTDLHNIALEIDENFCNKLKKFVYSSDDISFVKSMYSIRNIFEDGFFCSPKTPKHIIEMFMINANMNLPYVDFFLEFNYREGNIEFIEEKFYRFYEEVGREIFSVFEYRDDYEKSFTKVFMLSLWHKNYREIHYNANNVSDNIVKDVMNSNLSLSSVYEVSTKLSMSNDTVRLKTLVDKFYKYYIDSANSHMSEKDFEDAAAMIFLSGADPDTPSFKIIKIFEQAFPLYQELGDPYLAVSLAGGNVYKD